MSETPSPAPVEFGKENLQHPHGRYQELQGHGQAYPVVLANGWPGWLVTSHDEARRLLADGRLSKDLSEARKLFPPENMRSYASKLLENMLATDPPGHTRLRRLVNKVFTSRAVERLRPRIEEIATDLLDSMAETANATVDLLETYAAPLPVTVICELLGGARG
jgi:cytochrome P450